MRVPLPCVCLLLLVTTQSLVAQDSLSTIDKIINFPTKFFQKINGRASRLERTLENTTEKYLKKLARQEARLKKKLSRIDSAASEKLFANSTSTYQQLLIDLKEKRSATDPRNNSYVPFLDTLKTSMRFLQQADRSNLAGLKNPPIGIQESLSKLNQLQGKFNQTEEIRHLLTARKQFLQQQLAQFGLVKEFKKFEQQVYYYQDQ